MKYIIPFLWLVMAGSVQAQVFPTSLAGIHLGAHIDTAQQFCEADSAIVLAQERHLTEILLKPQFVAGVKSGSIAFANCAQPGRIVRVKLKFDNESKDFFEELLKRYKKQFGDPLQWRGDPFQTVQSWKWRFKDDSGQQVNLELTHSQDEDDKVGNFVKITLRSLWEQENLCQQSKSSAPAQAHPAASQDIDYSQFIPK